GEAVEPDEPACVVAGAKLVVARRRFAGLARAGVAHDARAVLFGDVGPDGPADQLVRIARPDEPREGRVREADDAVLMDEDALDGSLDERAVAGLRGAQCGLRRVPFDGVPDGPVQFLARGAALDEVVLRTVPDGACRDIRVRGAGEHDDRDVRSALARTSERVDAVAVGQ